MLIDASGNRSMLLTQLSFSALITFESIGYSQNTFSPKVFYIGSITLYSITAALCFITACLLFHNDRTSAEPPPSAILILAFIINLVIFAWMGILFLITAAAGKKFISFVADLYLPLVSSLWIVASFICLIYQYLHPPAPALAQPNKRGSVMFWALDVISRIMQTAGFFALSEIFTQPASIKKPIILILISLAIAAPLLPIAKGTYDGHYNTPFRFLGF